MRNSLFAGLWLCLIMTGLVSAQPAPEPIPPAFFGLTVQDFRAVMPQVPYATTRTWDTFDGGWDATPGLDWPHISVQRGSYDFTALDHFLALQESRRAEVIYTFGRTPQWASSQPAAKGTYGPGQCAPPARLADWDAFVTALATHVHGRIHLWEMANEPNNPDFYCGDIATMVTLIHRAAVILKHMDPAARILSPAAVSNDGPAWMDRFLASGGGRYLDVLAFHGYWSDRAEDILPLVQRYCAIAAHHGLERLPLWDTEVSWAGRNGGVGELADPVQRANFLVESYLLHWSAGVRRMIWYAYDGQPIWGQLWDRTQGLHVDGAALGSIQSWMTGAVMTSPCLTNSEGTWTCKLLSGKERITVLWNSRKQIEIPFPVHNVVKAATTGEPIEPQPKLKVGSAPVLIY